MTPSPTPLPADAPQDLGPLIALYNSTNGPNWRDNDNWLTDRPLYDWFGLKVNIDGRVTEIDLGGNWLDGTLPPELGELDQLQRLIIENSHLSGIIPREFGRLTQLEYLILRGNDLTGPIPHELGLLPNLRRIDFDYNQLSGELPPSLLASESITHISIWDNELTGPIPSEITERSQLEFLVLGLNQLTGEIPPEIGRLQHLQELWIHHNQITGNIPNNIGQLLRLRHFLASSNQLTGPIPDEISNLRRLERLRLDDNQLTGTIPEGLGDIESLEELSIAGNDFTGCIPSNLRKVEESNIAFANIEVCGEPTRSEPVIPAYIHIVVGDAASQAETRASQLAVQWVANFVDEIGWPTPENTITVYINNDEGLVLNYATHMDSCNIKCATRVINDSARIVENGAVFVPLSGSTGYALNYQVADTARMVFRAILLEPAGRLSSQGLQPNPKWWTEGLATLVGQLATADVMDIPRDEQRQSYADDASRQFEPLWELEDDSSRYVYRRGARHPVAAAAIDLLASQVGLRKLTEFYTERIDGEDWRQTFQRVFGISVPDFYERFNQHHRNGYPLRPLSAEGSTQWP